MTQELNNQVVGNVGLYYVCYRLSSLGWNVMPTARNARGIDIMIYSQDARQCHTIQVKSLSKCPPVPLGKSLTKLLGDYFVICRKLATDKPECFILTPAEVNKLAHHTKANKSINGRSFWLQPKAYDKDEFREKWERIGAGAPVEIINKISA